MLSICIPIFRFNVTKLVTDLVQQIQQLNQQVEIILLDDYSNDKSVIENKKMGKLNEVSFFELEKNVGRSKIRNQLAEKAKYPYLLFMDCDSEVPNANFLQHYLENLQPNTILYGGRSYHAEAPEDKSVFFRWLYGVNREQSKAAQRKAHPYKSFMTNNFVVPKNVFQEIQLDESLTGYGHEDTLFGIELKKRKIEIKHFDNPLVHIGLEPADQFLKKTEEGIKNLALLIRQGRIDDDVKLFRFYLQIKKWKGLRLLKGQFLKRRVKIEANLMSDNPELGKFDFYKLGLLALALEDPKH